MISIVIPTYNERENIEDLVIDVFKIVPDVDLIIVDDSSPDGTGEIAEGLRERFKRIYVIHRNDRGRGKAGIVGFKKALEMGSEFIMEMDADFSHNPLDIPKFIETIKESDVVIGSRYVNGGKETGRNIFRRLTSRMANLYIKMVLNLKVSDCTSGFRLFRREVLNTICWDKIISRGPSIVEEILFICDKKGFRIKEIPIEFQERKKGITKLTFKILIETLFLVPKFKNIEY